MCAYPVHLQTIPRGNICAINKAGKWELFIMPDVKDSLPIPISGILHN